MKQDRSATLLTWNRYDYIKVLESACNWFGVTQGRSKQYTKLVKEFYLEGKRSQEHLLALSESAEVVDLYKLWEPYVHRFPGILEKLRKCLGKGPLLQEDENPNTSTNRPRNDAFVYLLAGELIQATIKVLAVEGIVANDTVCHDDADIAIECNSLLVDIQCKRPQTEKKFSTRYKEACKQILSAPRDDQQGIIAIDCSSLVRPSGKILKVSSPVLVPQDLDRQLIEIAKRNVCVEESRVALQPKILGLHIDSHILGLLLFARTPVMTKVSESAILTPLSDPFYSVYRPDSATTFCFIPNINSPNLYLLRIVYEKLAESIGNSSNHL